MIYIVLMLGTLLFVLLLYPTLTPAPVTPEDTRRTELEEEREVLLRGVQELQGQVQGGQGDSGLLTREKLRLAQVLQELDDLPPAPAARVAARPATPLAAALLVGAAVVVLLGAQTFFKEWRYGAMGPGPATQLRSATRLPALERTATRTEAPADLRAWGQAAWDAGQYQVAAKAYTQLLMKERQDAPALRRVGYFLLNDEQMAGGGLDFIRRSVAADPKDPEGQLLYGYALGLFGQYPEALKVLQTYQQLAPDSREADDMIVDFQARVGEKVDGKLVFAQNCASCHGAQGQGGTGPKLVGSPALNSEAALRQRVLAGGTGMPAFPQLEGQQLDALVKFVQGW